MPTLCRVPWPPVFDCGTPNSHKLILDFMGEVALKASKAGFGSRRSGPFRIASLAFNALSSAVDCHLTVSTF